MTRRKATTTPHSIPERESDIQAAICDYLSYRGYLFSRTNNLPVYDTGRKAFRALPKYTRKGWPDICLIAKGTFYGIECKSSTGKLSVEQKMLGEEIEAHGGIYIVARSISDVQAQGL
jgi:hypothetical protein